MRMATQNNPSLMNKQTPAYNEGLAKAANSAVGKEVLMTVRIIEYDLEKIYIDKIINRNRICCSVCNTSNS